MNSLLAFNPAGSAAKPTASETASSDPRLAFDPSGHRSALWTFTARAALRAVLLHLRASGALPDKNAELLMPRWACTSLYNTVQKVCFPTIQDTPSLRGVLAYHQYGFPQRLDRIAQRCRDRGLFLIENCVNCAFEGSSSYGMGQTGLAAIFSLPKMFRTVLGGALTTENASLASFCDDYFRHDEPWSRRLCRASRRLHAAFAPRGQLLQELAYSLSDYPRAASPSDEALLRGELAAGVLAARKARYARLRREFADTPFFEGLEEDVIPYVVPLFGPQEFLTRLASDLSSRGWESGVYQFDAARDVFEPRFVPCVPLPVHQALGQDDVAALIDTIRAAWKRHDGQR